MRCIVKSAAGYYARVNGQPRFVQARKDALIFPTKRHAQGLVRILADRRIRAVVEPLR